MRLLQQFQGLAVHEQGAAAGAFAALGVGFEQSDGEVVGAQGEGGGEAHGTGAHDENGGGGVMRGCSR